MNPPLINISPLSDIFAVTAEDLDLCETPLEQNLPAPPCLAKTSKIEKQVTAKENNRSSPTSIHAAPQIFQSVSLKEEIGNNYTASLSSIVKNNNFKSSLKSVLSRPSTQVPNNSTLTTKHIDRSCGSQSKGHRGVRNSSNQTTQRSSAQNLRPRKSNTVQKQRPVSCSKLSKRKSQDIVKRPCELADKAIAYGIPLTKEQARAIRNRQHAMASRLRAKQKREFLVADNTELKQRILDLENEQLRLRKEKEALRILPH